MTLRDLTFSTTPWVYDTSDEISYSLLFWTGGSGRIFLHNESTKEKFVMSFFYETLGKSKDLFVNYAESLKSDPSAGFGHVVVRGDCSFGRELLPCYGYLLVGAATAGLAQPSFMSRSGGQVAIAYLGPVPLVPLVMIPFYGRFNSALPSVGVSAGLCRFDIDW
jgi:hypothetical protein